MAEKSKYKDLLGKLQKITETARISTYIPSLDSEVKFKSITVKQQKSIITSTLDAIVTNTIFNNTVNSIIKENCDPEYAKNLLIIDRIPAIITLRTQALGYLVRIEDPDDNSIKHRVNIEAHVSAFNTHKLDRDLYQALYLNQA